eukprot:6459060-Amphidinium_carterae.1
MEECERQGEQSFLMALDWSKAFDSVPHDALITVLSRFNIPPFLLGLIRDIYTDPQFRIRMHGGFSRYRTQE